ASTITVTEATTVTALHDALPILTFAQSGIGGDSTGTIVTVAGSPQATLPYSAYFDSGSSVSYAYSDPVGSTVAGKRYALTTPAATPGGPVSASGAARGTGACQAQ